MKKSTAIQRAAPAQSAQVFVLESHSGAVCKVNGGLLSTGMQSSGEYYEIAKAVLDPGAPVGSKAQREKYGVTIDGVACATRPFDMALYAYAVTLNTYHCRAVRVKAKDIAGAPWKITGDGSTTARQEIVDFFEDIFDGRGFNEGLENIWTDYEALGNAYVEIIQARDGVTPAQIDHIPSTEMWIRLDGMGFVQMKNGLFSHFRRWGVDPNRFSDLDAKDPLSDKNYESGNVTWMWHFTQYFPWSLYYGIPSIMPAWNRMALTVLETEYNLAFFGNNAIPDYAVILEDAQWADDAEDKIRDYFKRHLKGQAHKTLVAKIPEGGKITFEKLTGDNAKEGSFRLLRIDCRDEVLHAHGIPGQKIGISQPGRLGNGANEQNVEYKNGTVVPGRKKLGAFLNRLRNARFPDSKTLLEFEPYDTDDVAQNATVDQIYLTTQVKTPAQVQAQRFPELPFRPGSDQVLPYKAGATPSTDPNAGEGLAGLQKMVERAIEEARA